MKIKGSPDYPGPPTPPEPGKGEARVTPEFRADQASESKAVGNDKNKIQQPGSFEMALREVARSAKAEGLQGEAAAAKVVDKVLEDVLGKEFMSGPQAASIRQAIGPLVTQDEYLMGKLQSILSRLQNK